MAAFEIVALDEATPQLRAPGSADTYLAPRALALTPVSLTGSAATTSLSIAQSWNTSGTPTAFDVNVTDTASNAASLLMNLRVGGSARFRVNKLGDITEVGEIGRSSSDLLFNRGSTAVVRMGVSQTTFLTAALGATVSSPDVFLARDAANTLALRNGTAAQAFNVYNTFTDASNYERGFVRYSGNVLQIGHEGAGTGNTGRTIEFRTSGFFPLSLNANTATFNVNIANTGSLTLSSTTVGFIQTVEQSSAPSAPSANNVRIYAVDNGAGKTRLMALFATGAAQQIAIEP